MICTNKYNFLPTLTTNHNCILTHQLFVCFLKFLYTVPSFFLVIFHIILNHLSTNYFTNQIENGSGPNQYSEKHHTNIDIENSHHSSQNQSKEHNYNPTRVPKYSLTPLRPICLQQAAILCCLFS